MQKNNATPSKDDANKSNTNNNSKKINDVVKELLYLYQTSKNGKRISHKRANDELITVASTANLSKLRLIYGLEIEECWVRKKPPEKSYKEFWLNETNQKRSRIILAEYGLI